MNTLRALISTLEARDSAAWTGTPGPSIIFFRAWLIWSLARLGETVEAETAAAEMRRLADEADLPLCRTIAHLSEGFALAFAGRMPEAEATLRVSLSLCRKWELFAWSTNISSCLGHVLSHLGEFEEGFELLEQAAERTRRSGILVSHANELAWLAEAHRLAGHADQAARQAEEAVKVACSHEERGNEALARCRAGRGSGRPWFVRCRKSALGHGASLGNRERHGTIDPALPCQSRGVRPAGTRLRVRLAVEPAEADDCPEDSAAPTVDRPQTRTKPRNRYLSR